MDSRTEQPGFDSGPGVLSLLSLPPHPGPHFFLFDWKCSKTRGRYGIVREMPFLLDFFLDISERSATIKQAHGGAVQFLPTQAPFGWHS